jgi:UDP-2-acetamido-3-amino-2,3-dideoxy-glucuronate N-acetyltransferase
MELNQFGYFAHPTAEISPKAKVGKGTRIWNQTGVREEAEIGQDCNIGRNIYIDVGVKIGNRVKVENGVSIYRGVTIEDGVFLAPNVTFTNDMFPRGFSDKWEAVPTLVGRGATVGANATVVCGVVIGEYAYVGAGAVVTRDVPPHGLAFGNPARLHGFVCQCARPLKEIVEERKPTVVLRCSHCQQTTEVPLNLWRLIR